MPLILIGLLALPLLEIAVLVMVGSSIGVLATLALVIFTGMLGTFLLRSQGFTAFTRLRTELNSGRIPDKQLADAAMIMLAGIFLIIPGFVSDIIGILLFIPFVRQMILKSMSGRVTVVRSSGRSRETVVDLEPSDYQHTDEPKESPSNKGATPWRLPPDKD